MLRSSTCSTSSPISHAPSETSSFANLCRIGLEINRSPERTTSGTDETKPHTNAMQPCRIYLARPCLLVDGDVGGEILGDGVDLAGGVAEVLVALVTELPVLWLVVLHSSATHIQTQYRSQSTSQNHTAGLSLILQKRINREVKKKMLVFLYQDGRFLLTSGTGQARTSCSRRTPSAAFCVSPTCSTASLQLETKSMRFTEEHYYPERP